MPKGRTPAKRAKSPVDAQAIAELRNLGEASAKMLAQAGIKTVAELREVGAVAAYVAVKRTGATPSLDLLYALEGALRDVPWTALPYPVRASLTLEADAYLDAERDG